jgi:glucose/arabinose dehydrogenase
MPTVLGLATHAALAGSGQQGQPKQLVGHVLKPTELPAPEPSAIQVPEGCRVTRFAEGLGKPRMLAVAAEPFASGFLVPQEAGKWGVSGRPVGLVVTPARDLLVADDLNGAIYAISYARAKGGRS